MSEEQGQICNCDGCGWGDCHVVCSYDCTGTCDDGCINQNTGVGQGCMIL